MNKFSVDYTDLQGKLSKKKAFRLSDVKHKIKKVAFDVVRFVDSDKIDDLWQIHRDGDDEYIVAMYDDEGQTPTLKTAWSVLPDASGQNLSVFYGSSPIKRIGLKQLGIPAEDAGMVSQSVRTKLATDEKFLNTFVNELSKEEREALTDANPSLLAGK